MKARPFTPVLASLIRPSACVADRVRPACRPLLRVEAAVGTSGDADEHHTDYHYFMCRVVAVLLLAVLASCGGAGEPPLEEVQVVPVQGSTWYAEWPVRIYVIRSQQEWEAAWADVKSIGNPPPPLPAVDFSQRAVVGASIGWTANACTPFSVHRIQRRGAEYQVEYGFGEPPPPNAGCVAIIVPAYAFALVPAPVEHVTFERRDL